MAKPNLLFVFGDQWRANALGYAGDPNVKTPSIDRFAGESLNATNVVSGCPVCTPYRNSLLNGQYPLTHGAFINDVQGRSVEVGLGTALATGGYETAWIGKWHAANGSRSAWIPPEHRRGFQWFQAFQCSHNYNHSHYYLNEDRTKRTWEGYDALAQTRAAIDWLRQERDPAKPFALFLSWGPPHNPFGTAPPECEAMYSPEAIQLPANVPASEADRARKELCGYYAHCSALDQAFGQLLAWVEELGLAEETIVIFTSDHGDMLGSQGHYRKQKPWDESVLVPFLLRWPARLGRSPRRYDGPIGTTDLMPTLLGLTGCAIPGTVEGKNLAPALLGEAPADMEPALMGLYAYFHEWKPATGARVWRGLRDAQYSYIATREGPWLLFDNLADPAQMHNLVDDPAHAARRDAYHAQLLRRMAAQGDRFLDSADQIAAWGYTVDAKGDPPITP